MRQSTSKHNRLQQLRGFCAAVDTGSISRAADELGLSQPSISLQIQSLERELGVTLFERRGPRITLTPDGALLHQLASGLVEQLDKLPALFAAKRGDSNTGRLDIAAGGSTILYLLPDFVKRFITQHPGVELKLHNVTGRDGLAMLRADKVDLAVGSMTEHHDDIDYRPLFSYEPVLICAPGHPLARKGEKVTIKEVAEYPLILPPSNLTTWGVVSRVFAKHKLHPVVKMEVGNWEVIKEYVRRDMGVSIVMSICLTENDSLVSIPMGKYFPSRSYGAVTRKGRVLSLQAQKFIEILRAGE